MPACRQEVQAAQRAKEERAEAIKRRRADKAAALPEEPEAAPCMTLIRVRLPNGAVSQRRFHAEEDSLARVYDFVDSLPDMMVWDYLLCSTYPRREFERDAAAVTLQAAGLVPNATLMVTNRDD